MKKIVSFAISLLMICVFALLFGCADGNKEPQIITISDVTVDLSAPENRVDVPSDVESEVFDADGTRLSSSEWLLNSKFSKQYIKSLGVGQYTFTYRSATQTGTIKLIVTDNQKPNYVFTSDLPSTVGFAEEVNLPKIVKEQDSYQNDYTPTYQLLKGETSVEVSETEEGFKYTFIDGGSYSWRAEITKEDGSVFEYVQTFTAQSFEEWVDALADEYLYDLNAAGYVKCQNGAYSVDLSKNTDLYSFTVSNAIIRMAMKAGKTKFRVEITSDVIIASDVGNGNLYATNDWGKPLYGWGFSYSVPYEQDFINGDANVGKNENQPRLVGMREENGKYVYWTVGLLEVGDNNYFQNKALRIDFADGAAANVTIKVTFE